MTNNIEAELIDVLEVNNKLGEGVTWDSRTQSLWWTDIQSCKLYQFYWETRKIEVYYTPERVCSFGLTNDPQTLLVAFENGLAFYRPESQSGKIDWLEKIYDGSQGIRLNDGRMDRQGRFWVGSMVEDDPKITKQRGKLYCLDNQRKLTTHLDNLIIPNSLCWSPDSSQMYFADSTKNKIMSYDFNSIDGIPLASTVFSTTDTSISPDGSDVDSFGNLWNAEWDGSRITSYKPNGEIIGHLNLPVSQPTCIAFGGPKLDHLMITSSSGYLSKQEAVKQPLAGNLFIYKVPTKGIESIIYSGDLTI